MSFLRLVRFFAVLCALSAAPGYAQCGPSGCSVPAPAMMVYFANAFHIPTIWPFSDGSASRSKEDCDDLQSRLDRENGKGLVTNSVNEFFKHLDRLCARQDTTSEELKVLPGGDLCLYAVKERFRARRGSSPGEFCKNYIAHISVEDENIVRVLFDTTDLPCDRTESQTLLYCEGESGAYSPELLLEE